MGQRLAPALEVARLSKGRFAPRCSIYVMVSDKAQDMDRIGHRTELGHRAHFRNARQGTHVLSCAVGIGWMMAE
jgi:hypothetical protein